MWIEISEENIKLKKTVFNPRSVKSLTNSSNYNLKQVPFGNAHKTGLPFVKDQAITEFLFPFLNQKFNFTPLNETCKWINYLLTRIADEIITNKFLTSFEELINLALSTQQLPEMLPKIEIDNLRIGREIPKLESVSLRPSSDSKGKIKTQNAFDLDLNLTFGKEESTKLFSFLSFEAHTSFVLNWPVPNFASLPITINFSLKFFDLNLKIKIPNKLNPKLAISLMKNSDLEFQILPQIGEKEDQLRLELISKLIENSIFLAIHEIIQEPNEIEIPIDLSDFINEIETTIENLQQSKIQKEKIQKLLLKKKNKNRKPTHKERQIQKGELKQKIKIIFDSSSLANKNQKKKKKKLKRENEKKVKLETKMDKTLVSQRKRFLEGRIGKNFLSKMKNIKK
ncbi:tex2 protein-related [Anaeramoeba flamelloides]|uniref:Tex2 protein-related n=1 Tax=Anaeramoeba flamelloides TaxID=1746091 RepID=A0ABQ8YGG3_9EUKA|nr:tex2 protein-related [Anaeramoeba flamelloides]